VLRKRAAEKFRRSWEDQHDMDKVQHKLENSDYYQDYNRAMEFLIEYHERYIA
jgi:hypothetical protein